MGELIINFLGPPPDEYLTRKVYLLTFIVFYLIIRLGNRCSWNLLNFLARCSPKQGICRNRISSLVKFYLITSLLALTLIIIS